HAINTKGTGSAGRMKLSGSSFVKFGTGRILPTVTAHAINTKGTGSAGRLLPTVNKHAINTKGTGTAGSNARRGVTGSKAFFNWVASSVSRMTDPRGNV